MSVNQESEKSIALSIKNLNKSFAVDNDLVDVIKDLTLDVEEGEFISIVGPSGCGKSTLFRIIGGLDTPTDGTVSIEGRQVSGIDQDISMVFQENRLFPWRRVKDNILFGLDDERRKKLGKEEQKALVDKYIELVDLKGFENSYPKQLSGGMKQRASIARTLISDPKVLLLDEPFSALDAFTRMSLQNALTDIWRKEKKTMILITHDIDEAVFLGTKIVVLSERPTRIKRIFDVNIDRPRDRSSDEFTNLRRDVMREFFGHKSEAVEYNI